MHPVSCTNNTPHDVTDLLNHGMVRNTKTRISWERDIMFSRNKKILNLCHKWQVFRSYRFVVDVTFKSWKEKYWSKELISPNGCLVIFQTIKNISYITTSQSQYWLCGSIITKVIQQSFICCRLVNYWLILYWSVCLAFLPTYYQFFSSLSGTSLFLKRNRNKNDASYAIPTATDIVTFPFLSITDFVNLRIFLKHFCSRFMFAVCVVRVLLRKQRPQPESH